MAEEKKQSKLCTEKRLQSQKLRAETKATIDKMVLANIPVTKASVMKQMNVSNSFVNTPEISDYIKEAKNKQGKSSAKMDITSQNQLLFRKLMASYVFQYALLDEQEAFLKDALKNIKENKTSSLSVFQASTVLHMLTLNLHILTTEKEIEELLTLFREAFEKEIPDWKKLVTDRLKDSYPDCFALTYLSER